MVDYLLKTKLVIISLALLQLSLQLDSASCPRGKYLNCQCSTNDRKCQEYQNKMSLMNCTGDGGLPCSEVWALGAVTSALGLKLKSDVGRDYCSEGITEDSVSIRCYCSYSNNVCHITDITTTPLEDLSSGFIDKSIAHLTFLERLDLGKNNLRCEIPASLGNLKKLKFLSLSNNFLNGSIPRSLGHLSSLQEFDLSYNNMCGEIPGELGNLSNLVSMRLNENEFTGQLPPELGNLIKLEVFDLSSNYLTGGLPGSFHNLKSLTFFGVTGNSLNGSIPKFISKWINLTSLYLLGNDFEEIPPEIFGMSNLQFLWVSNLQKSNFILANVGKTANLGSIYELILRNCSLTGPIPEWINSRGLLRFLDLSFNNLTGEIPHSIENVTKMLLTGNMLDGPIPSFITDDSDLSYNDFSTSALKDHKREHVPEPNIMPNRAYTVDVRKGCGPRKPKHDNLFINCGGEQMNFADGHQYDADTSQNRFYQSPGNKWAYSCAGEFSTYRDMDSSDYLKNMTCGVSGGSLHETARLCPVSLTYYGFCLHKGEYNVRLHFAEIVYTKDGGDSSRIYGKRVFDVYIQGERVLQNFNIKKGVGGPNKVYVTEFVKQVVDDNLLEISFVWDGKGTISYDGISLNGPLVSAISVTPNFPISRGNKLTTSVGITIACSLGLLLLVISAWGMYKIIRRRQSIKLKQKFFKRNGGLLLQQQLSSSENNVEHTKLFDSKDLEKATDNYNTNRILGQGGQGTVYKGMLTDGRIVAIKKSKMVDENKLQQFINEVVILSQVNHRNVVKLLGCCLETEVPLLVYEFIPNGTLFQHLRDQNEEFPITWEMRLRIAAEIASALSYLHHAASVPIYHRDIKSTNILLDVKYRAKVSDFGTSLSFAVDQTHVTTRVQGTFGYLDPEYFQSNQFTEKSDVYSFGVVLVELLTGQKPICSTLSTEVKSLAAYFLLSMQENRLFEILDARVLKEGKEEEIVRVAKLAKRCLNLNGKKRPTMKAVAIELEGIRASNGVACAINEEEQEDVDIISGQWDVGTSSSTGSFSITSMPKSIDMQPLIYTT